MSWTSIATIEHIPLREGRAVDVGDREIAIFNLGERLAAVDANCPHRGGPLCDGILTGSGPSLAGSEIRSHAVVCPLHGWKIDLITGAVINKPEVCVKVDTYDVRVRDGIVEVDIPEFTARELAA